MPTTPPRVALFVPCLVDAFFPRVAVAVVKVLERFGCRVTCPPGQTCCGQPALHAGLPADAAALARRFVERFESAEYVVAPSPACAAIVREQYPQLLGTDAAYESAMWHVAGRTYDFAEFLRAVLRVDLAGLSLPLPATATYHRACAQRSLGVPDDTPAYLNQLGNLAVRPLPGADRCCGFGGPFADRYPTMAAALAAEKAAAAAGTGADRLVCNEAGCRLHLARAGVGVPPVHLAELIAEALRLDTSGF